MAGRRSPRFVAMGALLLDEVRYHDRPEKSFAAGGSALYAALGAALTGIEVGLVSIIGEDYPADLLGKLEAKGIDLSGVRRLKGGGGRCIIDYTPTGRSIRYAEDAPGLREVSPGAAEFPKGWYGVEGVHLGPSLYDWQMQSISWIRSALKCSLTVDPTEHVPPHAKAAYLARLQEADFFMPSEAEFTWLTDQRDLSDVRAVMRAFTQGTKLKTLVLKRGERGVCAYHGPTDTFIEEPAITAIEVVDLTGAGDTFCGAFHATWVITKDLGRSLKAGVKAASLCVQGEGCSGTLNSPSK